MRNFRRNGYDYKDSLASQVDSKTYENSWFYRRAKGTHFDEEILTLLAIRIKYIQGLNLIREKNNVHLVENQTIKTNACDFEQWALVLGWRLHWTFLSKRRCQKNKVMSEILKNNQDVVALSDLDNISVDAFVH